MGFVLIVLEVMQCKELLLFTQLCESSLEASAAMCSKNLPKNACA